jgi:hypothetical protein
VTVSNLPWEADRQEVAAAFRQGVNVQVRLCRWVLASIILMLRFRAWVVTWAGFWASVVVTCPWGGRCSCVILADRRGALVICQHASQLLYKQSTLFPKLLVAAHKLLVAAHKLLVAAHKLLVAAHAGPGRAPPAHPCRAVGGCGPDQQL